MLFVLFGLLCGIGRSAELGKALSFPKKASTANYVLLKPDFSEAQEEISVCSWLKVTANSGLPWFSYATSIDYNTILLKVKVHNIFRSTLGTIAFHFEDVPLLKGEWYHFCFTWGYGKSDLYINSIKIKTTGTALAGKVIQGGTLVLGQEQDSLGGGFDINDVFGGEMYNLNVFKKKLSLEDVAAMFYSGRCARLAKCIGYDVILSWKDILAAKRSGDVRVVDAGCGSPDMMELRARLNDITNATDAIEKLLKTY